MAGAGLEGLEGRVVLVTGASRGIGRAIATSLCARGARVAMLARGEEELRSATSDLGEAALPVVADVGDPESVNDAVGRAARHFGALHAVVNNAAVGRLGAIASVSDRDLRDQVAINFLGPIHCIRAAVPFLRAAGGGDIINVSSDSVERPFPFLGVYAATKGGLETLTRALRAELAVDGIRVTLVRSGPSLTTFAREWAPDAAGPAIERWYAEGYMDPARVVHPETVGDAVVQVLALPREAIAHMLDVRPA